MLKQFFVAFILLISSGASAQTALLDLLVEDTEFQLEWIDVADDQTQLSIQLCPRGTCDRFVASEPNLESFVRFVDAYLVFASGYVWLSDLQRDIPLMPYIQKRLPGINASDVVTPDCGSALTIETISCSLNALAESLEIEKFFVRGTNARLEEGWRERELTPGNIASKLNMIAGYGLPLPDDLTVTPGAPRYWESSATSMSESFRDMMRERVAAAGLPDPIDISRSIARDQELNVVESYRIEPIRLEELPCWENRSCDYPTYEGTVKLIASTSESTGQLTRFELTIDGVPEFEDLIEQIDFAGVFDLTGITITDSSTYLPMPLRDGPFNSVPSISVTGLAVSDEWCASGLREFSLFVALGPRGGRGFSSDCRSL